MDQTSLAYYCGIDELNLAYLACGATGVVTVVGNVAGDRTAALIAAVRAADLETARAIQTSLIGLTDVIMRTSQGAIMAKAALARLGIIELCLGQAASDRVTPGTPGQAHRGARAVHGRRLNGRPRTR